MSISGNRKVGSVPRLAHRLPILVFAYLVSSASPFVLAGSLRTPCPTVMSRSPLLPIAFVAACVLCACALTAQAQSPTMPFCNYDNGEVCGMDGKTYNSTQAAKANGVLGPSPLPLALALNYTTSSPPKIYIFLNLLFIRAIKEILHFVESPRSTKLQLELCEFAPFVKISEKPIFVRTYYYNRYI